MEILNFKFILIAILLFLLCPPTDGISKESGDSVPNIRYQGHLEHSIFGDNGSNLFWVHSKSLFNSLKGISKKEEDFKKFAIYLELLGQGLLISLNLEYRFDKHFAFRIGAAHFIFGVGYPLSLYFISDPQSNHHFECGVGLTLVQIGPLPLFGSTATARSVVPCLALGYRYQPKNGGLLFRATFTPFLIFQEYEQIGIDGRDVSKQFKINIELYAGISLGIV
ncbi:MAG: hypothetical protein ACPLX7_07565 [Candidatus Kapaibacteriota bacterium]